MRHKPFTDTSRPQMTGDLQEGDLPQAFVPTSASLNTKNIGVESERFFLKTSDFSPLPWSGDESIQTLLKGLADQYHWQPEWQGDDIISLKHDGDLISIEPGGQVELSCHQEATLDRTYAIELNHLREVKSIVQDWDIFCCGLGSQPMATLEEVPWVPKIRYKQMKDYFLNKGPLAHHMMKMTSSIQVSADYHDEADSVVKVQILAKLLPIFVAIFGNSCISEGKFNGYKSFRSHIWQHTDNDRCGIPPCFFEDDFSWASYAEYALDVPLFYIEQSERVISDPGITFRQFLKIGHEGINATWTDWLFHLSCLFPDIRLKQYIEIRAFDRQSCELSFAIPVLIKSLLYGPSALMSLKKELHSITHEDCQSAMTEAAKEGLDGQYAKQTLRTRARELILIAKDNLLALQKAGECSEAEVNWFSRLEHQVLKLGQSPADLMIDRIQQGESVEDVIRKSCLSSKLIPDTK